MKTIAISKRAYGQMRDEDLILSCKNRDCLAFRELARRYEGFIASLFRSYAADWNDIADLTQEVLIRVWRGIGGLKSPNAFKSWLSQIVANLFYDELVKRSRHPQTVPLELVVQSDDEQRVIPRALQDTAKGPEEIYECRQLGLLVREAIESLPPQFKTAIVLHEIRYLSYLEIADITRSSVGTVKSRISRAKDKLQALLGADPEGPKAA